MSPSVTRYAPAARDMFASQTLRKIFSPPSVILERASSFEILRYDVFLAVILEWSRKAAQRRISRKTSSLKNDNEGRGNVKDLGRLARK